MEEAINKAGGLAGLINDGDTVGLKPNILELVDASASSQQLLPEVNGITTDYRVMQWLNLLWAITQQQFIGLQKIIWQAHRFPPGIYHFRIQAGKKLGYGKMIVR